ncbi:putative methyltransferase tdiE [Fusarium oxysporum f. sp. albedinis]|nr:putative methyltransferase tdiE [Fusarium oxysporum f. sp. albedinis]
MIPVEPIAVQSKPFGLLGGPVQCFLLHRRSSPGCLDWTEPPISHTGDDDDDDDDKCDAELKHAIRKFYISLICQTVGSRPFRFAVLSFCAMLSRKKTLTRQMDDEQRRRCTWSGAAGSWREFLVVWSVY